MAHDIAPAAERTVQAALAEKLLHAWAQNRQQVGVPLALNLGRMEPAARGLLLRVMAAALAAGGAGPEAAARLGPALRRVGAEVEVATVAAALAPPPDVFALMAEVEAAGLGAPAYAAAAAVLDRRNPAARAFLDWLAARLALPASLAAGLARRYRG